MKRDYIAREMSREIVVGTFMVMIFLGLAYFTIILSRETWFSRKYEMEVAFTNVMGLRDGDNVVVRGTPVGKVKRLQLVDDRVHVMLTLDAKLHIKKDYMITVVPTSLLGGRYLEIDEGTKAYPDVPLGGLFVGREPYDLVADAGELINYAKEGLISGKVIDNLREAAEDIHEITSRLRQGKGTIGRLLSEDDSMHRDISESVAALKAVIQRLEKGEGTVGKLLSSDDTVYTDLRDTVANLKSISGKIDRGEGALGRLLADDSLYVELESMLKETRAAIDDLRETSPVTTFTSVFFGAL